MKQPENKQIVAVFIGHGLAILLAAILIAFTVHALTALQQISSNLYQHPFTVNVAAQNVEIGVLTIRKEMLEFVTGTGQPEQSKQRIEAADSPVGREPVADREIVFGRYEQG